LANVTTTTTGAIMTVGIPWTLLPLYLLWFITSSTTITAFSAPAPAKSAPVFTDFSKYIEDKQKSIIATLESEEGAEGAKFLVDAWQREDGTGHGATCVLGT